MRRLRIQILGLIEVRKDKGDFIRDDDVRLVYSGGTRRERGVALRLDHQGEQSVSRG